MEAAVRALFERYERLFNQAIHGAIDVGEITSAYAPEFIAASRPELVPEETMMA